MSSGGNQDFVLKRPDAPASAVPAGAPQPLSGRESQSVDADQQRNKLLAGLIDAIGNLVPSGPLLPAPYRTITGNYVITVLDYYIRVDCSLGPVTITLPVSTIVAGRSFVVKKVDAGPNVATVNCGGGGDTIDGDATYGLYGPDQSVIVFAQGSGYDII